MISRVAEHCFWFGRYLERTESTARVLQVTRSLGLDSELSARACWAPVVIVAGEQELFEELHDGVAAEDPEVVQQFMVWNDKNPSALASSARAARENARAIRDVLSREVWESLNELHVWLGSSAGRDAYKKDKEAFYARVRDATQLCLGQLRGTMLHDDALDFIWLGVLLERVGQTARMCDVHHHALASEGASGVIETAVWRSLLRACSGLEPFMRRHQARVTGDAIAAFLMLEGKFPRSVRYCVSSARDRLADIRPPAEDLPGETAWRRLRQLDEWLAQQTPASVAGATHDILTHIVEETSAVCDGLASGLFTPALAPDAEPSATASSSIEN